VARKSILTRQLLCAVGADSVPVCVAGMDEQNRGHLDDILQATPHFLQNGFQVSVDLASLSFKIPIKGLGNKSNSKDGKKES
jgi:hypothetical protein